ncbi:unnamed protein product, partial [Rotaria sp. Silwood2]
YEGYCLFSIPRFASNHIDVSQQSRICSTAFGLYICL